jgi:hypothetical protein
MDENTKHLELTPLPGRDIFDVRRELGVRGITFQIASNGVTVDVHESEAEGLRGFAQVRLDERGEQYEP